MIFSASRRTDLPAFFPDFLEGRIARSRKLEALVFWTKDVRNLVRRPELAAVVERIPCLVQFTATGLAGSTWEPGTPQLAEQLPEIGELGRRLPRGAIVWRFDPIMPAAVDGADQKAINRLLDRFRRLRDVLAKSLAGLDGVTVSFPDPYRKAATRAAAAGLAWPVFSLEGKRRIIEAMVGEFSAAGAAPIRFCCEPELAGLPGTAAAACVDGPLLERLYGQPFSGLPRDAGQRPGCNCVKSTDIGSYGMPCGHGCLYCYANAAPAVPGRAVRETRGDGHACSASGA
ncbi:MAG: DUF1848 domain-containing protein [Planctomycetota bacterium]|jgi:hypothetical protein|nr:DUF1848 domain-containing protein [Planctomycetota bacterium]